MRNDYIDDYGASWTHGLRRLVSEGARFRNAAYPYFNTVTCAGHATIGTGTVPAFHGIILNQWWHREDQRERSCTDDPSAPTIPYGSGQPASGTQRDTAAGADLRANAGSCAGRSRARRDHVNEGAQCNHARRRACRRRDLVREQDVCDVGGVQPWTGRRSCRNSSAHRPSSVTLGRRGTGCCRRRPTSTWMKERERSRRRGGRASFHTSSALPGAKASDVFYTHWASSPFADEYLERMAEAAIDAVPLGQGTATDYLGVSFSALDSVGHKFGPRSHEVQDMLARLDVTIGRLLDHLDARVGRGKYVVALSADHGVAVIPEQLKREGIDAGRAIMNAASARAQAALVHAFGPGEVRGPHGLHQPVLHARGLRAPDETGRRTRGRDEGHRRHAGRAAGDRQPRARTRNAGTPDPLLRATALGEFRGRSGDFIVLPRTNWFWVADDGTPAPGDATTHGTGYPYDTRVPLLLLGAGVQAGHVRRRRHAG